MLGLTRRRAMPVFADPLRILLAGMQDQALDVEQTADHGVERSLSISP